ncbi:MAG: hypothetical protein LUD18_10535 [Lachnospiraceae bacterium]|nr:hypothetical protein [Lachnospiraceae bacterium]
MSASEKKLVWEEFSPDARLKYEIAEEPGLPGKGKTPGWKFLAAKETDRIGGRFFPHLLIVRLCQTTASIRTLSPSVISCTPILFF